MIFEFKSMAEFKARIENKDLKISTEIFNQIKKAFYSKVHRKKVTVFTVAINGEEIDFILERQYWVKSLETCVDTFAEVDMFEECIEIQKMIKELKTV
jgi:hypothetical protein